MRKNAAYTPVYTAQQEQSFSELLKRHKGIVYHIVNRSPFILEHERDDYFQEAVMYAWRRYYLFDRSQGTFSVWLYTTAQWGIKHYYRSLLPDKSRTYYFEWHSSWFDIADEIYQEEHIESLLRAVGDLPQKDQYYVQLYLSGRRGTEISFELGKPATFLEKQMIRIRKVIREKRNLYFENISIDPRKLEVVSNGMRNEMHVASKPVIMLNLQGHFIKRFPSLAEVERQGFSRCVVGNVCNGIGYTHGGYRWMYEGEDRPHVLEVLKKTPKKAGEGQICKAVDQFDMDGNFVQRFPSMRAATLAGFNSSNILKYIKGELRHYKGYTWKYAEEIKN